MRIIAKFAALSLAALGANTIPISAMAQIAPPSSGTYSGHVILQQNVALNCILQMNVDAPSGTVSIWLNPVSVSSFCPLFSFASNPYNYAFDPITGNVTVTGVYLQSPGPNDCTGDLTAVWDDALSQFLITTTLPGINVGLDCEIEGIAY